MLACQMHKVGNMQINIFTVLNYHITQVLCLPIMHVWNYQVNKEAYQNYLHTHLNFSCSMSITYTNQFSSWKLWTLILIFSISLKHEGLRRDEETLQPSIYLNKYVSFVLQALFYVLTHYFVLPLCTNAWPSDQDLIKSLKLLIKYLVSEHKNHVDICLEILP